MIVFDQPAALAFCALPLAWAAAGLWAGKPGRRGFSLPLDRWGADPGSDAPAAYRFLLSLCSVAMAVSWILLALAAAGPNELERADEPFRSELDLAFVVDVSPSMAAMDLAPTRLDAARSFIRSYLLDGERGAGGASVGIVAFGASAALACPPTNDYAAVADRLASLQPGMLGDGTAIGQGLALAQRHLLSSGGARKVAILLTDGEDNVGLIDPLGAAADYARLGDGLAVIGLGTKGDVPFEYTDPATGRFMSGSYRSDYDEAALSALARAGGGEFLAAQDARALDRALATLGRATGPGSAPARGQSQVRTPLGAPLVLAAMALAALAWTVRRLAFGGVA